MSEAGENIRLQKAVEQYRVIRIMWIRLAWKETMVSSI